MKPELAKAQGYQQALIDFGVTELNERISDFSDEFFSAQLVKLSEAEIESLSKRLIQLLVKSLNGHLLNNCYLALREEEMETTSPVNLNLMAWSSKNLQLIALPSVFPDAIEAPLYADGERCRWIPIEERKTDWGTIVGRIYAPVEQTNQQWIWCWHYLIFLDADSPSRPWVTADWAAESDLELLPPERK